MDQILRTLFEGGFVQHFYSKYQINKSFKLETKVYKVDKLKMQHFSGCFLVLIIGYSLSILYFLVERICGNLNHITQ